MRRREFLVGSGALGTSALFPSLLAAQGANSLGEAAEHAVIYAMPLLENAFSRAAQLTNGNLANTLVHDRALATPAFRAVTTPNNDTLYSRAWCDLAKGPVTISVPPTGDRYVSIAFMDMYSNNFAVLGTRASGSDGGVVTLVGPDAATRDPGALRAPTRWVWVLVRLLVDGEADLAAAHALQDRFSVRGPSAAAPPRYAGRNAEWQQLFASVQALILENQPPATDGALLQRIAPLGITTHGGFDSGRFSAAQAAEINAGIERARTRLRITRRQGPLADGWVYPKYDCGIFAQDYFYRAQVAIGGLGALPRVEAMYMRPINETGGVTFPAGRDAVLHLPAERMPAVNSFWSVTMYEMTPDGQYFMTENPIKRYSLGDRTPGIRYNADRSLDIWMTRERPSGDRAANWLPTPRDKTWGVVFRAYLPKDELIGGTYTLPPLTVL